jgi:hypothetical protein
MYQILLKCQTVSKEIAKNSKWFNHSKWLLALAYSNDMIRRHRWPGEGLPPVPLTREDRGAAGNFPPPLNRLLCRGKSTKQGGLSVRRF